MPKGNVARAIETAGPLLGLPGTPTGPYSTTWTYYEAGAAPVAPASCAGSAANQRGLTQALIPAGVATTTNVYGVRTDLVSVTNNAGATCRNYDMEGRLTSERAPGETQDTTYSYDPAGQLRSQSDASGAITSVYNEAGALIDTVDSYGAEMRTRLRPGRKRHHSSGCDGLLCDQHDLRIKLRLRRREPAHPTLRPCRTTMELLLGQPRQPESDPVSERHI